MNWNEADQAGEFKLFKQKMELFFDDREVTDDAKKATKMKIALGSEGLRRINASGLTDDEKKQPQKIWDMFEAQLKVRVNFRIHRMELMRFRQKRGESIDEFVNRCNIKAKDCDFTESENRDRIIELVIASTPFENFQRDLLDKSKDYTIEQLKKDGRQYEAVTASQEKVRNLEGASATSINAIKYTQRQRQCSHCGLTHPPRRCPAYMDTCKGCGAKGHWMKMCRKTKKSQREQDKTERKPAYQSKQEDDSPYRRTKAKQNWRAPYRKNSTNRQKVESKKPEVNTIGLQQQSNDTENEDDDLEYQQTFYMISVPTSKNKRDDVYSTFSVQCPEKTGKHLLKLKVDTGANGNTLPLRIIRSMYPDDKWKKLVKPVKERLTAYNGTKIPCEGSIELLCLYKESRCSKQNFYIVDIEGPAVVGFPTCEEMHVITINTVDAAYTLESKMDIPKFKTVKDLKHLYPQQFDSVGNFKVPAKLLLKEDANPSIDPPRKFSIHLKDKLREELNKMEQQGIIRKVMGHTGWCSSLATSVKKDGSLRICLDPKRLNNNLKRCPHKIPTLEELNPAFSQAKFFSKLDAKAGYWSVHLEEESQELTTFRTPFGCMCFLRLPFGLSVSQDIFQQRMDAIFEQAPGCVGIADDVAVFGATEEEHDRNLINLLEVAKREGLVFNSDKCTIKTKEIDFFGSVYSDRGIRPDQRKVEDIQAMPTPQDKDDLQRFLGLMTYMSPHISTFAEKAAPLRELLKKDAVFLWQEDHQATFEALKHSITLMTA